MTINIIHDQDIDKKNYLPEDIFLINVAQTALLKKNQNSETSIRIVNSKTITSLNKDYRQKNTPTNVLAFNYPKDSTNKTEQPYLGDIAICQDVVNLEAINAKISHKAHWAHMIIHAILHLQGYDHQDDTQAAEMEKQEIILMHKMGFKNPYQSET